MLKKGQNIILMLFDFLVFVIFEFGEFVLNSSKSENLFLIFLFSFFDSL